MRLLTSCRVILSTIILEIASNLLSIRMTPFGGAELTNLRKITFLTSENESA